MKQSDFEEIYALLEEAGLSLAAKERELYECSKMIQYNPSSCYVAIEKGRIIGCVFGTFNGRRGLLYHLAVHPTYQKKGYGSLLLKKAEESIKELGATKTFLWISVKNLKVISFYEKNGWSVEYDALPMVKDFWERRLNKGV